MVQCAIGQTIQTFDWRIMNFNNGKATMTIVHLFKYRYMCTTNTFVGKKRYNIPVEPSNTKIPSREHKHHSC